MTSKRSEPSNDKGKNESQPRSAAFSKEELRSERASLKARRRSRTLQKKVQAVLKEDETEEGIELAPSIKEKYLKPRPLKVNLDLATYHARRAVRERDFDSALRRYQHCVELDPLDGRGWLGLARLKHAMGSVDDARLTFKSGLKFCRRNAFLLQAWGVMEERTGNIHRARNLLRAAVKADRRHCASWVALGLLEQRQERNHAGARKNFLKAVEVKPSSCYAWQCLAMLDWELGRTESARQNFERGVGVHPTNAATWHAWGTMEHSVKNIEGAAYLYKRALKCHSRNVKVLLSLACLESQRGRTGSARSLLERALKERPLDGALYQALGLIAYRQKDLREARQVFRRGTNKVPTHSSLWQAWGLMEAKEGNFRRAFDLFQQGIWANPRSPSSVTIWHVWGTLEFNRENFTEARRLFNHGLRLDPQSSFLLQSMARLEAAADDGQYHLAQQYFEKAVKSSPTNVVIWRTYAKFEDSLGHEAAANNVRKRAELMQANEEDRRCTVSGPQAGDYASLGTWISEEDLHPRGGQSGAPLWIVSPPKVVSRNSEGHSEAPRRPPKRLVDPRDVRVEDWFNRPAQPPSVGEAPKFSPFSG